MDRAECFVEGWDVFGSEVPRDVDGESWRGYYNIPVSEYRMFPMIVLLYLASNDV